MLFRSPLAPAVKYVALNESAVDVIDGYSTDGLLARYELTTLVDDKAFFPPYEAAALVSPRLGKDRPDAIAVLGLLSGRLDEPAMRTYNRRIEVDGEAIADVAADLLQSLGLTSGTGSGQRAKDREKGRELIARGLFSSDRAGSF